ncbi:MAG: serine/threonine protein kinase [Myxococcales bacterium]|nr:serine/threonine protein kinase [Myxococcales bacterium]
MVTRPSGRLKGRFEIMEQIGEGGFATVYRAKESTTQKVVALKLLKDAYLKDAEVVERFRREVFAVASISSPYVVKMHDFGISGDEVFIAMEYVEGPTLREVMHERPWSPSDIHVIIGQIAQALAAAHRQNIVHRDLKPENVMLVGDGGKSGPRQVKVLDFGLAKLAELERKLELEPLTRAGMCFGTPQYMSPEQIQGKPIDGSADVYALGVIAYEMIAGLLPWDGADSREILLSVIKTLPPKIVRARSAEVKRLDEINKFVLRALAKDKKDRPRDPADFFKEFEMALLGERKPVPRIKQKLDAKDEVFASVFAASIELPALPPPPSGDFGDTMVETLPGEFPIEPTFGGSLMGSTMTGVRRRRRMRSAWMMSVGMDVSDLTGPGASGIREDQSGPFTTARTMPHHSPRRNAIPSEAMPLPPLDFTKPSSRKDSITNSVPPLQRRDPRGGVPAWLVAGMLILVVVAAAMGFWFGRRPH